MSKSYDIPVVETDIVSWLVQYDLLEKGAMAQPYRLQYEWLRVMARNRHHSLNSLKVSYQKEKAARALRQKALQSATLQDAGITASMLPTRTFKHTPLEKIAYGIRLAYRSVMAAITLVFVLVANKVMQWLTQLGVDFVPAMDVEDVRYQDWLIANPKVRLAVTQEKQRWSEYNMFWGSKSVVGEKDNSIPRDEAELVGYLDAMAAQQASEKIRSRLPSIRAEIRKASAIPPEPSKKSLK